MAEVRLDRDQLEKLAELVSARLLDALGRPGQLSAALVDVHEAAAWLGVDEGFVYKHADELGARRLGGGRNAPLRFNLVELDERMRSWSGGRRSSVPDAGRLGRSRRRRDVEPGDLPDLPPIRSLIRGGDA